MSDLIKTLDNVDFSCIEAIEDENLQQAIDDCLRDRSYLPIIKQELKCTIQCKRLGKGLHELELTPETPPIYLLRCDEVKKRHIRRLQNRESSIRSRKRKNDYIRKLEKEIEILENEQILIRTEIENLKKEKKGLEIHVSAYKSSCRTSGKQMVSLLNPIITKCLTAN